MPVDTPHPATALMRPEWMTVRDVLAGPRVVKAKDRATRYLPRLPGHRLVPISNNISAAALQSLPPGAAIGTGGMIDEYDLYLDRAVLMSGFAERVLNGMVGMATRKPPVALVPTSVAPHLDNLTLDGTTLAGLSKQLLSENISVSFGGILVDWSERWGRPYQRHYLAEDVLSWRMGYLDGQPVPTRVVLSEQVPTTDADDRWTEISVPQCRVLELVPDADLTRADADTYPFGRLVHRLFRKVKDANGKEEWQEVMGAVDIGGTVAAYPFVPVRWGKPLGFVPFQPCNSLDALWCVPRPAILNLINMILAHYKNSADYENAIHIAGVPMMEIWGINPDKVGQNGKIEIGPGRVIIGEAPTGHAGYVMTEGLGAAEIKAAMESKEAAMATMAARLLLSQERRVAISAESQQVGFAADDASLTTIVDAVEQALTNAMVWHAWWAGPAGSTVADAEKEVSIKLNRDFIQMPMPPDELNRLGIEVDAQRLSRQDYFLAAQRGGLIRADLTYEDYLQELAQEQADAGGTNATELQASLAALKAARLSGDEQATDDAIASLDALVSTAPEGMTTLPSPAIQARTVPRRTAPPSPAVAA